MKKAIFFRTAPYDYRLPNRDLYDSFDLVALGKAEPLPRVDFGDFFKKKITDFSLFDFDVFCSGRRRSLITARQIIAKPKIKKQLNEILFSMADFISKREFYALSGAAKLNNARKKFVNGLLKNELQESFVSVLARAEEVLATVGETRKNSVFFSHGFFMKIVESLTRDPLIAKEPKRLLRYFDGSSETFHFGEGFVLGDEGTHLSFDSYIKKEG